MQRRCRAVVVALWCVLTLITIGRAQDKHRTAPSKEIVEATNRFALKLLKQTFRATPDKNIVISPLSLSYSFGLLQNGASPAAREEIANVFEFGSMKPHEINTAMRSLRKALTHDWTWKGETYRPFRLSTSLWIRGREAYRPEFLKLNKQFYGAELKTLTGDPAQATAAINSYARQDSGGRTDNIVTSIMNDQFVLMAATHMVCGWGHEVFLPVYSENGVLPMFHGVSGDKPLPMMYSTHSFKYDRWNDTEAIKAGCLNIFLPSQGSTLAKTVDELTPDTWTRWTDSGASAGQIMLVLPKLTIDSELDSKATLQALGLRHPFSGPAALNRTLTNPAGAKLTRILQRSFLKMNEFGVEVGSVTYAGGVPGGIEGGDRPRVLVVDRPFAFVLTDVNGAIVYVGAVVDPKYAGD